MRYDETSDFGHIVWSSSLISGYFQRLAIAENRHACFPRTTSQFGSNPSLLATSPLSPAGSWGPLRGGCGNRSPAEAQGHGHGTPCGGSEARPIYLPALERAARVVRSSAHGAGRRGIGPPPSCDCRAPQSNRRSSGNGRDGRFRSRNMPISGSFPGPSRFQRLAVVENTGASLHRTWRPSF